MKASRYDNDMLNTAKEEVMISSIWMDVRHDGAQIADRLRRLGFEVQGFMPFRDNAPRPQSWEDLTGISDAWYRLPLHVQFPKDCPVWSKTHVSLAAESDRPGYEEVARLWKMWRW